MLLAWKSREGPHTEECRQPLEAGKGKEIDSPAGPLGRRQPSPNLDCRTSSSGAVRDKFVFV